MFGEEVERGKVHTPYYGVSAEAQDSANVMQIIISIQEARFILAPQHHIFSNLFCVFNPYLFFIRLFSIFILPAYRNPGRTRSLLHYTVGLFIFDP
jgi:hypothetical protein